MRMDRLLRISLGSGEPAGELAKFLSATLANWMKANPEQSIEATAGTSEATAGKTET